MSTHFEHEIREQPERLRQLLARRSEFEAVGAAIHAFAPRFVVTAARGSSGNAALYARYLWGVHHHLVVGQGAPSLLTLYESPPSLRGALVIGVSQSGQSPDVVALVAEARHQGALTVAITNAPDSPMAKAARYPLALRIEPELAIAATKSYTAQLMALAMLSAAVTAAADGTAAAGSRWDALASLPEAVERTLELHPLSAMRGISRSLVTAERAFVIGRGFNLATACELALKLKETAYISAEGYSTADFLHGPIAVIDANVPAILVAPRGPTLVDLVPLLTEMERRDAPLIVLSNGDQAVAKFQSARVQLVSFSNAVEEWLSPIVSVIPGQLLACAVSSARGIDPDRPRGLAKITTTL
jgi:glucosamine--fructose-6-phosphate aminotransferase (isomerizing)